MKKKDTEVKLTRIKETDKRLSAKTRELLVRAGEILDMQAAYLKLTYPNLAFALTELRRIPVKEYIRLATDGMAICYNPEYVCRIYTQGYDGMSGEHMLRRELLHILIHGLLGHYEMRNDFSSKKLAWGLMDYCVDNVLNELLRISYHFEVDDSKNLVKELGGEETESEFPFNTYLKGVADKNVRRRIMRRMCKHEMDDHRYWYIADCEKNKKNEDKNDKDGRGKGASGKDKYIRLELDSEQQEELRRLMKQLKELWGKARMYAFGRDSIDGDVNVIINMSFDSDMKRFDYGHGSSGADGLVEAADNNGYNYSDMLKELEHINETSYEDPDSIDTMMYQFGLDMYQDMPLVEPLIENERLCLNTIVIAIDTSGSCCGSTASQFIRETNNLLEGIERAGSFQKVILLECDADICGEHEYGSADEFGSFGERVQLHGFGGTDFRPVFDKVKEYIESGETVDALIYLTDGCGEYPKEDPGIKTYFVMENDCFDEQGNCNEYIGIPDWITPVRLEVENNYVDYLGNPGRNVGINDDDLPFF